MFLKEIYLKNFKCFEEVQFNFPNRFTVLIGDNGSGKTALVDGIARGLKDLVVGLVSDRDLSFDMTFSGDQIRRVPHKLGSRPNLEKQLNYGLGINICAQKNTQIKWHFEQNSGNSEELRNYVQSLRRDVQKGKPAILPLIVYYRTDRHWSTEYFEKIKVREAVSRLQTYSDSLNPKTSARVLLEWFQQMALIQLEQLQSGDKNPTPPELEAVRQAILKALDSLNGEGSHPTNIYYSAKESQLMIDVGNGNAFPFQMLSDGYRNTLGMIADIAYRMAELNPHLTTETPGIVLIDELDLHLHPKWQRSIVGDLKRIFPNCQFVVTTHSPFIIQSLDEEDGLIKMDEREYVAGRFIDQSIEDITESEQGIENPQWSKKRKEMYKAAEAYYEKLDEMNGDISEADLERIKTELELIKKPFTQNVAYTAFLERKQMVKESQIEYSKKKK